MIHELVEEIEMDITKIGFQSLTAGAKVKARNITRVGADTKAGKVYEETIASSYWVYSEVIATTHTVTYDEDCTKAAAVYREDCTKAYETLTHDARGLTADELYK